MKLADLPTGSFVFVDANVLVFYFTRKDHLARACADFLTRAVADEIQAVTSVIVVAEVIHRVMIAEAVRQFGLLPRDAAQHLKQHPQVIRQLREHLTIPSKIHQRGLDILPVTYVELHSSCPIRAQYGLMTNDSLIAAVMRQHKVTNLATTDPDFERVDGIVVWKPL